MHVDVQSTRAHVVRCTSHWIIFVTRAAHSTLAELDLVMLWERQKAADENMSRSGEICDPSQVTSAFMFASYLHIRLLSSRPRRCSIYVSNPYGQFGKVIVRIMSSEVASAFMFASYLQIRLLFSRPRRCSTYVRHFIRTVWESDCTYHVFYCRSANIHVLRRKSCRFARELWR